MPSGYGTALPGNLALDEGVLYDNSTTAFGVTKGPLSFDPAETWQAIDFAGRRCDVALLDRVIMRAPKITGTLIALNTTISPILITGSTQAGSNPTTVTPLAASALMTSGMYRTNSRAIWKLGDGTFFIVKFAMALWKVTAIRGVDKDKAEIDLTIEAKLDLSASTNTDTAPLVYQFSNAV